MAADKAVVIELLGNGGNPVEYTVADANNISQGDILQILDPRTASFSTSANFPIAGIAAQDKKASDGITVLPVWTYGVFDVKTSGSAITAGQMVIASGNNLIALAPDLTSVSGSHILGKSLDTATATAETIPVLVRV